MALSGSEAATAQTKIWQPKDVPTVSPFFPSDFFRVFWILSELPTPPLPTLENPMGSSLRSWSKAFALAC